MKIGFASDHAGYQKKTMLIEYLKNKGHEIVDFGTNSEESCDYPDFGHLLANSIEAGECNFGISICYTGNGINMAANKHSGIRSALCWEIELSFLARSHNDANVCAIPAKYVSDELSKKIVDIFLNTPFEGGRHLRRINKIPLNV